MSPIVYDSTSGKELPIKKTYKIGSTGFCLAFIVFFALLKYDLLVNTILFQILLLTGGFFFCLRFCGGKYDYNTHNEKKLKAMLGLPTAYQDPSLDWKDINEHTFSNHEPSTYSGFSGRSLNASKNCPICGEENKYNATFCEYCNYKWI
jgi:hypothetical protein